MHSLADVRAWLNPRHARFWIVILLITYTLAGFFLVPWLIKRELPTVVQDLLQRPASVAAVRFNPWTLALEADEFELRDTDGSALLSIGGLRINLQVASLFRRALVFREIILERPAVTLVRDAFADTNLGRLMAAAAGPAGADNGTETDQELLRLVIETLQVDAGVLDLTDKVPATPFNTRLAPINISVNRLSTLPNDQGEQLIRIRTEGDGLIEWAGSLQISPLDSDGRIKLQVPGLPLLTRYLDDVLDFDLDGGQLDLALDYAVAGLPDGGFEVAVDNLTLNIGETELATEQAAEPFFGFGSLRLAGGTLRWPEAQANAAELVITGPRLDAWLRPDGSLNLTRLLAERGEARQAGEPAAASPTGDAGAAREARPAPAVPNQAVGASADPDVSFVVRLGRFRIEDLAAGFEDRRLNETGTVAVEAVNLEVRDVSNVPDARFPFDVEMAVASGGAITASGELGVLPLVNADAVLNIDAVGLAVARPWVDRAARVTIDSGAMSAELTLASAPEETLDLRGLVTIDGLVVDDPDGTELITWQQLAMEDLIFQLDARQLEIARMRLRDPYARVIIDAERNLNFSQLVVEPTVEETATPEEAGEPIVFRMGTSFIRNGRVEFSDLSLPLPFSTPVQEFGGSISALATDTRQASELDFEGRVGEFGQAKVTGQLIAFDPLAQTDVRLQFRNVNLPDLSPYTVDFAGRKIAAGKLNLDLEYAFEDARLLGKNSIVIDKIKLGDKVDNPDALDLPLGLAVALLTDTNGIIDVKLNVEGDVNDPEFSARGVIGKAFANLLTKIVTSPFRLLGGLAGGGEAGDLQNVSFEPGEARLSPPMEEQLTQLSSALAQRPALTLSVPGAYAEAVDRTGLATVRIDAAIQAELEAIDGSDELLADRARDAMEALMRQRLPEVSLGDLRARFPIEDDDPNTPEFDTIAYLNELKAQLVAAEPVSAAELQGLGDARATAIADYLETRTGLAADRLQMTDTMAVEPGTDDRVLITLELDAT